MNPQWQQQQQQRQQFQAPQQYPQPTGFQPQSSFGLSIAAQPTGFQPNAFQRSQVPPVPPIPASYQQPQPTGFPGGAFGGGGPPTNFQQPTPQHSAAALLNPNQQSRFLSPSPATGGAGGLAPQPTGLVPQQTGWAGGSAAGGAGFSPLVAQPTGFGDPRMSMMSQTFMPANTSMPYGPGSTPQFAGPPQQAQGLSLQQSIQQHNQTVGGGPKISWALSKDERKSYDNIFRAWDAQGSGFVSGKTALEVFGQSGLSQDDLSKIWDLADSTNRGSLNLPEFHVAMGLIYRALNGAPIPTVLPPELVPPSERDLGESVNFLKDILSKDSHERASNGSSPNPQYGKIRSLHGTPAGDPLRGSRKDGAAYVHDDSDTRGYKSSSRHLDRRAVRYGGESPASDLDEMKRQLQSASSQLDSQLEEENARTREDEELEDELNDLKYRVKRVQEDLDRTNRGPRSVRKDEDRRRYERELLQLLHEKIPEVERKLEDREREKQKQRDSWRRDRDRRNADSSRYGRDRSDRYDSYDNSREEEDRGYLRGTYDDRDGYDRHRDRGERDRDSERDRSYSSYPRTRSPPASTRTPPLRSSSALGGSTRSPPPTSSTLSSASAPAVPPSPAKMTPAEKAAFVKAEAQRRMQERMRALGVSPSPAAASAASSGGPEVDSSVEERLARERKEAQEKAEKAEREAEEREKARRARVEEAKGILGAPASTSEPKVPVPAAAPEVTRSPPAPPVPSAQATPRAKPAPPPVKPRAPAPPPPVRGGARVAPQPPKPPVAAPTPPVPVVAPPAAPAPAEEDDEDAKMEAELARLREAAKARANEQKLARRRELERQLEEARREEESFLAKASTSSNDPKETSSTPVQAPISPPRGPPALSQAPAPTPPSVPPAGSTNPFHKFTKPTPQSTPTAPVPPPPKATPSSGTGTNPFFKQASQPQPPAPPAPPAPPVPPLQIAPPAPPAPPAPALPAPRTIPRPSSTPIPAPKTKLPQADDTDEDWDSPKEKDDDSDSSDEDFVDRAAMNKIAGQLFGSGGAPSRPQSAAPALAQQQAAGMAPPQPPGPMTAPPTAAPQLPLVAPAPPPPPPMVPPPPPPAPSIPAPRASSGTGDRSALFASIQGGKALRKTVTNDRSGVGASGRVIGDAAPPAHISDVPHEASPPVAFSPEAGPASQPLGLAADGGIVGKPSQSIQAMESHAEENEDAVPHITIHDHDTKSDDLADVDLTKEHRSRTLYAYEAQRAEEISFGENQVILAHPSKSGDVWWYGSLVRGGPKGFFPNTYVQVIDQVFQAKALYTYNATNQEEMSFSEGDTLDIIDKSEADWWKTEKEGSILIVPASYLELHENAPASLTDDSREPSISPPVTALPPPRPDSPSSEVSSEDEYLSAASDEGDNKEASSTVEDRKAEAEARALERQRVLEAAGLIIKPADASAPPRPPRKHRPPPKVPERSSKATPGTISGSQVERDLPEIPKGEEPAMRLEDAYDRYEAFRRRQQELPPSGNRLSIVSTSSLESSPVVSSPTGTVFSVQAPSIAQSTSSSTGETARHGASAFLHSFLGRRTPGPEKKSITISAPMPVGGEIPRTPSPAFGTSWSSLVDKDVLEGIPPAERKRQEAIFELIVTESAYVRDLQLIVEVFYTSLIDVLDQKATTVIFANVEDILLCNTSFYSVLEERQKDCRLYMDQVGDILQVHIGNMAVYTPYCVNQSVATKILQTIRASNPDVASRLQKLKDDPVCRNLDLSSYLLIPMQRITRYPLLLRQILNYTQSETERKQLEWAITTTERILDSINETIRENEGAERLAEISRDLYIGEGRLDLTARTKYLGKRKLVKEGEITKAKSGRKLNLVLCNDVLVLLDAAARSLYRMPIPLSELKVRETPGDDLGFQLGLAYPRGGDVISVKANSARDCQQWMQVISQASEYCKSVEQRAERRKSRSSGIGY